MKLQQSKKWLKDESDEQSILKFELVEKEEVINELRKENEVIHSL